MLALGQIRLNPRHWLTGPSKAGRRTQGAAGASTSSCPAYTPTVANWTLRICSVPAVSPTCHQFVTWPPLTCLSVPAQIIRTMHAHPKSAAVQPRWRAILRLILGQAQVVGATITLVFLLQGGVSTRSIWGVILTGLVSLVSILLFRVLWREKPRG
jgi:hypothetical protein